MGNLRTGHLVEGAIWLSLCLFLYAYSFEFDKNIEIYKFGATAWPRSIILLIAIAALGQLFQHWKYGDIGSSNAMQAANVDDAEEAAHEAHHESLGWYLSTFALLVIPFAYMRVPDWIAAWLGAGGSTLHILRVVCAVILVGLFLTQVKRNMMGAMLTLPLFFAALLEDMGFYSLAPIFIVGVMFLFGETRPKPMLAIMALIYGLLMALFVKILFVGLPVGNIRPFYDFGSWVVTVLQ
ncbi:MAG: hypothetical protein LJE92_15845 [Gammaproteobacteria bacterium]|jgi:hypothetical protein|nr:hypothetical protein [Gammaproteobacteria bacterium]